MILPVHDVLRARLRRFCASATTSPPSDQPALAIGYPPTRALGDLALPVAFELARRLRKAPRVIAQELAGRADRRGRRRSTRIDGERLSERLPRPRGVPASRLDPGHRRRDPAVDAGKTIVEHTAINPNKAAHIGHLRNSALGDTLVRVLRFRGVPVEVQNYIDDTGVQVADVVVGFEVLEHKSLDEVRALAAQPRFDYYCWDLYAKVTEWYQEDKTRLEVRQHALHRIEHGGNPTAEMAAFVADAIVRRHLETMHRLGIEYDLLTWEGDILRLRFWAQAFDILKTARHDLPADRGTPQGLLGDADRRRRRRGRGRVRRRRDDEGDDEREKVIVRSNGTVTYVGKDIAYQFWKFGLLGLDFHYRPFATSAVTAQTLWATTSVNGTGAGHPSFGGATMTYNVIDVRQSYLQKLLTKALAAMGHQTEAERSIHFSYEMVALSHQTARDLGYEPPAEDSKKPFVEVSGRKGLGVKADDLIDLLERTASAEVAKRNPELSADEDRRHRAADCRRGGSLLHDQVLARQGDRVRHRRSAQLRRRERAVPAVRRGSREQHLREAARSPRPRRGGHSRRRRDSAAATALEGEEGDELWGLVLEAARLDEIVEQVVRSLEFSVLAKHAFSLAQAFNAFYHRAPILNEEREDVRLWRAAGVAYVRLQLTRALDLMGIAVPARM